MNLYLSTSTSSLPKDRNQNVLDDNTRFQPVVPPGYKEGPLPLISGLIDLFD